VTSRASPRTTPAAWCAAGLALLRDEGIEAVTVDRLCAALGKTKGSFYHHFADLDAYLGALLARWEEELTEATIRAADAEADLRRRAARLDEVVSRLDHGLDRAVRAWALRDARARDAMARVDERRIAYLAALHAAAGHRRARELAELEYLAFVGAQQLDLAGRSRRGARLAALLQTALAGVGRGR
jgi:AcrR family transcriptional regulator